MNRNYQKELDKMLKNMESNTTKPTLLLHSCCAPCSSYVLEYLVPYFKITVFFYNPNITKEEEYQKRIREVERLIKEMGLTDVSLTEGRYDPQEKNGREKKKVEKDV